MTGTQTAPAEPAAPPASGAWRHGDPPGRRLFADLGTLVTEQGVPIPDARIAYETFGTLAPDRGNALLVLHGLSGDSHLAGPAGPGHPAPGWWTSIVGPGRPIDTDRWFAVVPNMLGGCQGSTGPSSPAPDGREWAERFPDITIRDQAAALAGFADVIGLDTFAAVIGVSMGGMHALEFALQVPARVGRLAVIAAPPTSTADQIAMNAIQRDAILADPRFRSGQYYDAADGDGPHRGLALARRLGMTTYRSPELFEERFGRSIDTGGTTGSPDARFAIESYLDSQSRRFTHRFDANTYLALTRAKNSHDIGRGRGSITRALALLTMPTLVIGISSDRLFPVAGQAVIAAGAPGSIDGGRPSVIESRHGHDAFLIEAHQVGEHLVRLLEGHGAQS